MFLTTQNGHHLLTEFSYTCVHTHTPADLVTLQREHEPSDISATNSALINICSEIFRGWTLLGGSAGAEGVLGELGERVGSAAAPRCPLVAKRSTCKSLFKERDAWLSNGDLLHHLGRAVLSTGEGKHRRR